MKSPCWLSAAALAGALNLAGATAVFAADAAKIQTVAPDQEIGLNAGPEHISGVFRPTQGRCALIVTVAESFHSDNDPTELLPERMQVTVEPGAPAHFDTAEGEEAQFECLPGAQAMKATVHDRVAAVFAP